MKLVPALLVFLTIPAFAFDAALTAENKTRPSSFVGVPWGASPEEATRILSARVGATPPDPLPADTSRIELSGGTFSGQTAERWTLEFVNRHLGAATVVLKNDAPATMRYRDLKAQLIAKYGPPQREGRPPIALGADKKIRQAQQQANPEQKLFGNLCSWRFTPTLADKEPKTIDVVLGAPGGILATDEGQLVVTIRYVNETFALAAAAAGKPAPSVKPSGPDDL